MLSEVRRRREIQDNIKTYLSETGGSMGTVKVARRIGLSSSTRKAEKIQRKVKGRGER